MKDIDNVIEQASELLEKGGISAVKEAFVDKPDVNKDNQTDKPVEEEDNIVSRLRKLRMKTSEKEETRFDVPSLDDLFSQFSAYSCPTMIFRSFDGESSLSSSAVRM